MKKNCMFRGCVVCKNEVLKMRKFITEIFMINVF
jgi:hypothetical protein